MNFDPTEEHRIEPGKRPNLDKIDSKIMGPFGDKLQGVDYLAETIPKICELQYRLFVEQKQSLLVVLQAPDAAGKDGAIRHVFAAMNPQGCRTHPFKVPTAQESSHDFLWRIHAATPAAGMVAIFNRSHYEDVLVVRVEDLVKKSVWKKRYDDINHFESLLIDRGTRILKFYLHISLEEQLERFGERLEDPAKHWKLNPGDYEARQKWDDYRDAYEDAIEQCNCDHAQWHVIPADRKWYRNAAIAGIVLKTLQDMNPQFPPVTVDLNEIRQLYDAAAGK